MPKKDSCPDCFSSRIKKHYTITRKEGKRVITTTSTTVVLEWECLSCGWRSEKEDELVSLKKMSVKKLGKLRSRMRRRRWRM